MKNTATEITGALHAPPVFRDLKDVRIPSIEQEARAKLRQHNEQIRSVKTSLTTETLSNILFVIAAYKLNLPHIEHALMGAALVYVPLAYDGGLAQYRRVQLKSTIRDYLDTLSSAVFDHIGLTCRGNRLLEETEEHAPFFSWKSIVDPIDIRPQNRFGIIGSFCRAAGSTVKIASQPVRVAARKLPELWGKESQENPPLNLAYLDDPCDRTDRLSPVIRKSAPEINPNAVVQMPADPDRLRKSLNFTKLNTLPGYLKIGFNGVGIYGATEFCYAVGSECVAQFSQAIETGSLTSAAIGTTWLATTIIGMGPAKHFSDTITETAERLRVRWAVANTKESVLKVQENVAAVEQEVKRHAYDFCQASIMGDDDRRDQIGLQIQSLISDINQAALRKDTQNFLHTFGLLSPTPDMPETTDDHSLPLPAHT